MNPDPSDRSPKTLDALNDGEVQQCFSSGTSIRALGGSYDHSRSTNGYTSLMVWQRTMDMVHSVHAGNAASENGVHFGKSYVSQRERGKE